MSCDPASRRPWQVHRVDGITRLDARGLWDVCFRGPLPWEEADHAEPLAAQFRGEDQADALTDLVIEAVVGVVTRIDGEHRWQAVHAAAVPELQTVRGSDIPRAPWALLLPRPLRLQGAALLAVAMVSKHTAGALLRAAGAPPEPPVGEAIPTAAGWLAVAPLDSDELAGGLPRALATVAGDYLRAATKDGPGEGAPIRWDVLSEDFTRAVRGRWTGSEWAPCAFVADWHAETGDAWIGEVDLPGMLAVLEVAYRDLSAAAEWVAPWTQSPAMLAFVGPHLPWEHKPGWAALSPAARAMAAHAYRFAAGHAKAVQEAGRA